jgi:hypothetical protein
VSQLGNVVADGSANTAVRLVGEYVAQLCDVFALQDASVDCVHEFAVV